MRTTGRRRWRRAYLKIWHWDDPVLGGAASVLTIHNIAHQGKYDRADYAYLGLQWGNFTADKFEDFGGINLLKGGILLRRHGDDGEPDLRGRDPRRRSAATASAPYLTDKGDRYWGILNGADYDHWDPATDPLIPARYAPDDLAGKARLQAERCSGD